MNKALSEQLQDRLNNWQSLNLSIGANVTIEDNKIGVINLSSGYSDLKKENSMPVNSKMYIYSITKTFTAIRILQLVEQSAVNLDEPISKYIPALPFPKEVTIRRLLNHTAGIPNYTEVKDYLSSVKEKPAEPWSDEYVISRFCSGKLDFAPGTDWNYSNTGYLLLKILIEQITSDSYSNNINNGIIMPLKLKNTYVVEQFRRAALLPGFCEYLNAENRIEDISNIYNPLWCKTGVLVSTTNEISNLYQNLFSGTLLKPSSLSKMLNCVFVKKEETEGFFKKPGYGLGLMIDPEWGFGGLFGHGGDGPGYNTWAMYLPEPKGRKLSIVIFCNRNIKRHPFDLATNLFDSITNY